MQWIYLFLFWQDPFDGEEFVERLAWRVNASISPPGSTETAFNPDLLHEAFTQAIKLVILY